MINLTKIKEYNSDVLATVVVLHRVLGAYKEEAKACMIELSGRKAAGDQFDFLTFIEENVNKNSSIKTIQFNQTKQAKNSLINNVMYSLIKANIGKMMSGETSKEEEDNEE